MMVTLVWAADWHLACPQVRIVVQHSEPKLTHLATRWTLPFEDSELKVPLKDVASFTYPELRVKLHLLLLGGGHCN